MARGWESKSVESQIEQAEAAEARRAAANRAPLTPDQIRVAREREGLELSRKRVLQELEAARHIRHYQQLEAALKHLDQRLRELAS